MTDLTSLLTLAYKDGVRLDLFYHEDSGTYAIESVRPRLTGVGKSWQQAMEKIVEKFSDLPAP